MFAIYFKYVMLSIKSTITKCLQFISNMFLLYVREYKHTGALHLYICLHVTISSMIYVNWINFNPSMDK